MNEEEEFFLSFLFYLIHEHLCHAFPVYSICLLSCKACKKKKKPQLWMGGPQQLTASFSLMPKKI